MGACAACADEGVVEETSSHPEDINADQQSAMRVEIQRRLKELHVCAEVAQRLADASDKDPTNIAKATAATAAVQRYKAAKEKATPESVAEEYRATLKK